MDFFAIFLTAIGLSMDAFAVAVCKGLKMRRINLRQTVIIALLFGGFQALMPFVGWTLGKGFEKYIVKIDHWIAFGLLAFIGGKMILESFKSEGEETSDFFNIKELFLMAIATSIDALAVGITFAFLKVSIYSSIAVIGITTLLLSALGVFVGHKFGAAFKNKAELTGGIILILIGVKILLEHLGILDF